MRRLRRNSSTTPALLALVCNALWFGAHAQTGPPVITQQPRTWAVLAGSNHTFSVVATGAAPLTYQWRFQGTNWAGQTNPTLSLPNVQTNQAGPYTVVVTNSLGAVTSSVALLMVRTTNDPIYAPPDRGWTYFYGGDQAAYSLNAALDGTWARASTTSDSWGDGRGPGNGAPGGIGTTNGLLTLEDAVTSGTTATDNRRYYLLHNLLQDLPLASATNLLNEGVTLSFRARLTPAPPADPLTELTNAPNGYLNTGGGRGMVGLRQSGAGGLLISFSLHQAVEDASTNQTFTFGRAGLHMNNLNGDTRNPNVDPGAGGLTNFLALDPANFTEFWITIQDNGPAPGTHQVCIYTNGVAAPAVFNLTAGTANEGTAITNYLALGLPSTPQTGAFDLDFFTFRPGVNLPARFNEPVGIVQPPASQAVPLGQSATFSVVVTGTPPFAIQWYRDGAALAGATNLTYTTGPVGTADDGAQFTVSISNYVNVVTSSPPAVLNYLRPPAITAHPQSLVVTNGDPASFTVEVQSASPGFHQWRFNGAPLAGETNAILAFAQASPALAGAYDVVVTNAAGAVTSSVATLTVRVVDFGDAPEPYPTLLADNGARHLIVSGLHLGAAADYELDGQPDPDATGDDLSGGDDEDGVTFPMPLGLGQTVTVQVVASTNGLLHAWLDLNHNGTWADPGEQVVRDLALVPGVNLVNFLVPVSAKATNTFARFRFSTAAGLSWDGPAPDGEVEDYAVTIVPVADLAVTLTDTPDPVATGSNLVYLATVQNAGPSLATSVMLSNFLPAGVQFLSASANQGACAEAGGVVNCALGSLGAGQTASVTITVMVSGAAPLTNIATAQGNELDVASANNTALATTVVEAAPILLSPPVSLVVTQGNTATFSVTASGTAPLRYQWRFEGADLAGRTNANLVLTDVQPANAGAYTVRVTNQVGSIESPPVTLTVLVPPFISAQPQSRTNPAGSTVVFTVTAGGTAPLGYQWYFNAATPLPNATTATLTLTNVQIAQTGDYTVLVTNGVGAITSAVARLTVVEMDFGDAPDPGYPTRLASDGARHVLGSGLRLGAAVDLEADGQPDASATGDDLAGTPDEDGVAFLTPVRVGQPVSVAVVASGSGFLNAWVDFNGNGSWADTSEQIFAGQPLVTGTSVLQFTVAPDAAAVIFVRFRFSSVSNLTFLGLAPDGEVEDYLLTTQPAADLAVSQQAVPPVAAVGGSLTYQIAVTNLGPSPASGLLLDDTLPAGVTFVSATPSQGACTNAGATVQCGLGSLPAGASATVAVVLQVDGAAMLTNVVTVTGNEADVLLANNTSLLVTEVQEAPIILVPPQSLTVTNGDTAVFTVTADGSALRYQWFFDGVALPGATNPVLVLTNVQPAQAGDYAARASNDVGSAFSDPATLTVLVPPRILTHPVSQVAVLGGTVSFTVVATGTEPLIYQWELEGADLPGANQATLSLVNVQADQAGHYAVRVQNLAGIEVSQTATLNILVPPQVLESPRSQTNFAGGTATLSVVVAGTEPLAYRWVHNGTPLPGAFEPSLLLTNLQTGQAGAYVAVITNVAGAATSAVAVLTVVEMDFGDAPQAAGYPTLLAFDGARHRLVPGLFLGAGVDFEPDGQPDATATGDDASGSDDEDGVTFSGPVRVGQPATVQVVASAPGLLNAWVDFDGNGTWTEVADHLFVNRPLVAGVNVLPFTVPATARAGEAFARFRFSTAPGLASDGPAPDGEVEDHALTLQPSADLTVLLGSQPEPVLVDSNLQFTLIASNIGPCAASAVRLTNTLPAGVTFVSVTASQGECSVLTNAATVVTCELGGVPAGGAAGVTVVVTPPRVGWLTNVASVTAAEFDPDPANNTRTLASTVVALFGPFDDPTPILGPDAGPATPYPSTIYLSGVTATVQQVTVTLRNLSHPLPTDLDVLLVGPQGQSVVLMSDAGALAAEDVTLTFDDASPLALPQSGRLVDETYRPTDYDVDGAVDVFAPPAPANGYGSALAGFRGTDPNGPWSLYVMDDSPGDSGGFLGGWSLTLATVEAMADLGLEQTSEPHPGCVGCNLFYTLTVTNRGPTGGTGLVLTNWLPEGVSLVSAVATQGSWSVEGGAVVWAVGTLDRQASATVVLVVTPTAVGAVTNVAVVRGAERDDTPANNVSTNVTLVKEIADVALAKVNAPDPVAVGGLLTYDITAANYGPYPAPDCVLTDELPAGVTFVSATASQGECRVVTNAATVVTCALGTLAPGALASVTLVVRPEQVGEIVNRAGVVSEAIDFNLANNSAAATTAAVLFTGPFAQPEALELWDYGSAEPYPSRLVVSGLTGALYSVTVTLSNLTHSRPDDLDVLLVGPQGQAALVMSDAGNTRAVNGVTLTFDAAAPAALPDDGLIGSGVFRPTDYEPGMDFFPIPAPPGPYTTNLAVFRNTDPNGEWRLYIFDDAIGADGELAGGWSLTLGTAAGIADVGLTKLQSAELVAVGQNVIYPILVNNAGPAPATEVRLVDQLDPSLVVFSLVSTRGSCTHENGVVRCELGALEVGGTALVVVVATPTQAGLVTNTAVVSAHERDLRLVNNSSTIVTSVEEPPRVVAPPVSQTAPFGGSVAFDVTVEGTAPLAYQWQFNDADLPGATNAVLVLSNLTFAHMGAYRVMVTNRVGSAVSEPALLTVLIPPVISDIADQTTDEDAPAQVGFVIGDRETPAGNLVLSVVCSDPALVPEAGLVFGGGDSNRTLTITPATNRFGSATVTVTVRDGDGMTASDSFLLTVRPVNDAPTLTTIADQVTDEDVPTMVTFQVDDVDSPLETLILTAESSHPALLPTHRVVFGGSGANRTATLSPAPDQYGTSTVTLVARDPEGAGSARSFLLTVRPVNDPPTLDPVPAVTLDEDAGSQAVALTGITSGAANEDDPLSVTAVSSYPALIPHPTVAYVSPNTTGLLVFTPATNASGTAIITVMVHDHQSTSNVTSRSFTVQVNPVNDPPTLSGLADQVLLEDTASAPWPFQVSDVETPAGNLAVLAHSSNPSLLPAANLLLSGSGGQRALTVRPATNAHGQATITLTVTDGDGASVNAIFVVTVQPVNDPPTLDAIGNLNLTEDFGPRVVPLTGIASGAANEADPLRLTATSSDPGIVPDPVVAYASPNSTGTLTLTPRTNAHGTVTIVVTGDDQQGADNLVTRSFTVTVTPVNDPPTLSAIPNQTTVEGMAPPPLPFLIGDVETPAASLAVGVASSNPALVAPSNLVVQGAGAQRALRVTPSPDESGTAVITVWVTDADGGAATNAFTVTVHPVNNPPTLNPLAHVTLVEDAGLQVFNLTGISSGAANESQPLAVTATSDNPGLLALLVANYVSPNPGGVLVLLPAAHAHGTATITVTVNDGGASNNLVSRSFTLTVLPVNDPPTLDAIADVVVAEDSGGQTVPLTGLSSGAANEIQTLRVTATSSQPDLIPHPTVNYTSPNAGGTLTLAPRTNAFGSAVITVTVNDGGDASNLVTRGFTVTVTPVNDPPTLSALPAQSLAEDGTTGAIPFTVGDVETPAHALLLNIASSNPTLVAASNLLLGGSGPARTLTVTPAADRSGTALVTVTVADGDGASVSNSFPVTVAPVNDPPTLSPLPDLVVTSGSGPQTVNLTGISSGAPDEFQTLTVSASSGNPGVVPQPQVSYSSPNATGSLVLTPAAGTNGTALITVTVNDGGASNNLVTRTLTVTVGRANTPPVISSVGDQSVAEDGSVGPVVFQVADAETPAANLTLTGASSNPALLNESGILLGGLGSNRTVTLFPLPNQSGTSLVTLTVTDGAGATASASFTLTVSPVNDPPTISSVADQTIDEDTATAAVPFTVGDVDTPLTNLTLSASSSNPALVGVANITLGGSGANRSLTVRPLTNQFGTATLTLTVSDGQTNVSTRFLLTVNPVNDPPTISDLPNTTLDEDGSAALTFVVTDVDTPTGSLVLSVSSSNPTLAPPASAFFGGNGTNRMLLVTPVADQFGAASLTVTVNDGAASASDSFVLTVNGVNDPPTLNALSDLVLAEDAGLQSVGLTGLSAGPPNEPQNLLSLSATSSNPALIPNPTVSYTPGSATGTLSFTPVANASGTAAITVTVNDGAATNNLLTRSFTVTVNPVNDPPTISAIGSQATAEDVPVTVAFALADADTPQAQLTLSATSTNTALVAATNLLFEGSGSNRTLRVVPTRDQFGTTLITVSVSDGAASASSAFVLSVAAVNDPPTLNPINDVTRNTGFGDFDVAFSGITSGATNEAQTTTVTASSSNPSVAQIHSISYTAGAASGSVRLTRAGSNLAGTTVISVTVSDGGATNNTFTRTFTFYVKLSGNAVPGISAVTNRTILEDNSAGPIPFTVGDSQTPATLLTVAGRSSNTNLLPAAGIVFGGSGSNRTVTLTPAPNQFGTSLVTLTVTDTNFGVNFTNLTLTVTPVNDLPTLSAIANQAISEDTPVGPLAFTVSDVETPAAALVVTAASSNPGLVPTTNIVLGGAGTNRALLATPATNQSGIATITLTVTDGDGAVTSTGFTITVSGVNDPPAISHVPDQTVSEDTPTAALPFVVTDVETSPTNLVVRGASSNTNLVPVASIVFGGSGSNRTVTLTPATNQSGTAVITLTVTNGSGASASDSFLLTVLPVNDPPTISNIPDLALTEDTPSSPVSFAVGDVETPAGALALAVASSNPTLVPVANVVFGGSGSNRTMTVTPAANQSGTAILTVTVTDPQGAAASDTVVVTVSGVNDLPVISRLADQVVLEDTPTAALAFTVGDVETAAAALTLSGSSSNPALVAAGSLAFGGSGSNRTVTVTPAANQFGSATVSITVTDGNGGSATESFLLTVLPVNDPPTLDPIADVGLVLNGGGAQTVGLSGISSGAPNESQPLLVAAVSGDPSVVAQPQVTYTSPSATGSLRLVPLRAGTSVLSVTVTDGATSNHLVTRSFTVTVTVSNAPPTLAPIADVVLNEDTPLTVALSGISAGATNEAQTLTVTAVSDNPALLPNPAVTYTSPNTTGSLRLTPATNASGSAVITVTVNDGQPVNNTTSRSFRATVNPVNDPPTIAALAAQSTAEDTPMTFPITLADADTPALSLTVTGTSTNTALVAATNIAVNGSGTNRTVTLTPVTNAFGTTLVTLTVSDGAGSSSASFLLTVEPVNDPPTLDPLATLAIDQNAGTVSVPLTGIGSGAANEGQTLAFSTSNSDPSVLQSVSVAYTSPATTGTLTFRPKQNAVGTATLTVTVDDGGASNNVLSRSFVVNVNTAGNARPTISVIANQTINEDTATAAIPFTIGDAETPAASLTLAAASSNPAVVPGTGIVFGGSGSSRTVTVTPAPNVSGSATITITVTDGSFGSTNRSFLVTVNAVNDLPTISAISNQTTAEDTPTAPIAFAVADVETPAGALVVSAASSNPTLAPTNNIFLGGSGANRAVMVWPATNQSGTATLTLTVRDAAGATASASFQLTVNAVNDPPVISDLPDLAINQNTSTGPLAFTVGDVESAATTLVVTGSSSNPTLVPNTNLVFAGTGTNRTLSITPATNQYGTATITVTVTDPGGASRSDSFLLTVRRFNNPPSISNIPDVVTGRDQPTEVLGFSVGDVETPAASLAHSGASSNPSLVPHGNILFGGSGSNRTVVVTPAPGQSGTVTITVTVLDADGAFASDSFLLTIGAEATRPTISDLPDQVVNEDTSAGPIAFTVGNLGTPTPPTPLTGSSSNPTLVPATNIVFGGSGTSRTVTVTPAANAFGTAVITVTVLNAQGLTASDQFLLTVRPVNDAPTLSAFADRTNAEDTVVGPIAFTVGDLETPAASLLVSGFSSNPALVPQGGLVFGGSGSNRTLTVRPATNQIGTASVTVTVTDTDGATVSNAFTLTITAVNDPPVIAGLADLAVDEDTATGLVPFLVADAETPASNLVVTVTSSNPALVPTNRVALNGSGSQRTLLATPATNQSGAATLTLTVRDADGATNSASFLLTVNPVNDPPVLSGFADRVTAEDTPTGLIAFAVSDVETPAGSLVVTASSSNPLLLPPDRLLLGGAGSDRTLNLLPATNQSGAANVTITVTDADGAIVSRSFTLTVTPVNDPPVVSDIADQVTPEDTLTAPIAFTVGDVETSAGSLIVTVHSSNPALVPDANILLGGSGGNRTLQLLPATNQSGTATITVLVIDAEGATASDSFVLTVTPVNDPPTISDIPDRAVPTGAIPFTVRDTETPAANLALTAGSSNPALVPVANVFFGGSGANRTVTVFPAPGGTGTALITVTVTDAGGATASGSFVVTVGSPVEAPSILVQPQSRTVAAGQSVSFTVAAAGTLPLSYQWRRDGQNLPGQTASTLTLPGVQPGDAGDYTVVVSNPAGSETSAPARLTVLTGVEPPVIVSVSRAGSLARITFTAVSGLRYTLEYQNTVVDAAWTALGSLTATGSLHSLDDATATAPTRFYRVRAE